MTSEALPQGRDDLATGATPTNVGGDAVLGMTPTVWGWLQRLERLPQGWGGLCEWWAHQRGYTLNDSHSVGLAAEVRKTPRGVGCALRPQSERETPTEVGRCLRESAIQGTQWLVNGERNPHRSGEVFARAIGVYSWWRLTPTEVGSTTVTTSCQCAATMIARIHPSGHPIKNSLRDPP